MGLFDNLFKTKPEAADEAVVEAAKRIAEAEKARLVEANKAVPAAPTVRPSGVVPTAKPGAVPAPRAYSPRSLGQVVTPGRAPGTSVAGDPKNTATRRIKLTGTVEPAPRPNEVVLLLEDVLPRIPTDLVAQETPDLKRELRFKVEDLSADIARGRAAVSLRLIAAQVPDLFVEPIAEDDTRQIRLPLQKLVEQIGFLPVKAAPRPAAAGGAPPPVPTPVLPLPPVSATLPAPPAPTIAAASPATLETIVPTPVDLPPPPGPGPSLPVSDAMPSAETAAAALTTRITLDLAAVLKNCPRELIVAELPPLAGSERITFPWAPIEKQLPSGLVDVSSVRFIFALPAYLQGYFEAREGVRVPLPLDEVRRNLPPDYSGPIGDPLGESGEAALETTSAMEKAEISPASPGDDEIPAVVFMRRKPAAAESVPAPSAPILEAPVPVVTIPSVPAASVPIPEPSEDIPAVIFARATPPPATPEPSSFSVSVPSEAELPAELREMGEEPAPPAFPEIEAFRPENPASESESVEIPSEIELSESPALEATPSEPTEEPVFAEAETHSEREPESLPVEAPIVAETESVLAEPEPEETAPDPRQLEPEPAPEFEAVSIEELSAEPFAAAVEESEAPEQPVPAEAIAPEEIPAPEEEPPVLAAVPVVEPPIVPEELEPVVPPVVAETEPLAPSLDLPPPLVITPAAPPVVFSPILPAPFEKSEPDLTVPVLESEPLLEATAPESVAAVLAPPPIFVPPPLRQSGATLAPEPPAPVVEPTAPSSAESHPVPPNPWMQPPPEIAARSNPLAAESPAPPPSPILPVRIVSPPVLRPYVAPPPLFGSEEAASLPTPVAPPEPVAPPPPEPLRLERARTAFALPAEAPLSAIGSELTKLPGITGCFVVARHESASAGELPAGFTPEAVRDLAGQLSDIRFGAEEKLGVGHVQHLTIFAAGTCVSFFSKGDAIVCAFHRTRSFLPGALAKLTAAAEALAEA